MTTTDTATTEPDVTTAVAHLIRFLETGEAPAGLFAADCFADVSLPHWWLQSDTGDGMIAIRAHGHPHPGEVTVSRVEPTSRGFVIEFSERWTAEGQQWYCRESIRADVTGSTITDMAVYCTGDWDESVQREHAAAVTLLRP